MNQGQSIAECPKCRYSWVYDKDYDKNGALAKDLDLSEDQKQSLRMLQNQQAPEGSNVSASMIQCPRCGHVFDPRPS